MDFLFDNPLANMSGPIFLVFYGAFIFFLAIAFYFYKSQLDWTSKQPTPLIPANPDPYEIAYLRGGENELARTLAFSLTQKGFLTITNSGKKSYISLSETQPNWTTLLQIERSILGWFQTTRETAELFEKFGLIEILKPFSMTFENKIRQNHLLTPNDVIVKTKLYSYILFVGVALLGSYKIVASVMHGRYNILFLIVFMIVALLTFWVLGKTKRFSDVGNRFMESLQNAFEKLKHHPQTAKHNNPDRLPAFNSFDPLLLAMGIYGTSVLVGNGFSHFEEAFERSNKTQNGINSYFNSSCSSGCGASCGGWSSSTSCSSGDNGSSCSSGSSCGGGCGGGCGGS